MRKLVLVCALTVLIVGSLASSALAMDRPILPHTTVSRTR